MSLIEVAPVSTEPTVDARRVDAHRDQARSPGLLGGAVHHPLVGPRAAWGVPSVGLARHVDTWGTKPVWSGQLPELLRRLDASRLTGRGGAHFPAARKWQAVARTGVPPILVANGAEGEAWSAKDATVLQLRPHLVLDGLAVAAEAFGASDVIVWLATEEVTTIRAVHVAIAERARWRLPDPAFRIHTAPHHYLSGESSSIVNALTNGVALPAFQRQPAAVSGIGGRPTLVHNVETWARIGQAARLDDLDPSGQLVTVVSGRGRFVVEARVGDLLADAVAEIERAFPGGIHEQGRPQAVLLGGFGGRWIRWTDAAGLPVDESELRGIGRSLGAGVIAVLPESECGLCQTSAIVSYLEASSARQCGPCMFGLPELSESLASVLEGRGSWRHLRRLDRLMELIPGRGACHHPDGAVNVLESALEVFADDLRAHRHKGRCLHGRDYSFLPLPQGGRP